MADTIEHLSMMMTALLEKSAKGEGLIFTFADIEKCFDNIFLSDSNWFLVINHVDPKALKVLTILLGKNKIRIQGTENYIIITDGCGQGGVTVGRSSSACISEAMERNVACHPTPFTIKGVNMANSGFVDDTATADEDVEGVDYSCRIIQDTFDELSLKAHPMKTVHVICGDEEWIKKTSQELESN